MELTPYLDALRRDLAAAAAPGGADISRAADLLVGALDASARLCLMEALSDAAAEITERLGTATVELRVRGRQADLVVTDATPAPPGPPPPPQAEGADLARVTLRLPESLKTEAERAAAAEGISVNAWLVRAVASAVHADYRPGPPGAPPPPPQPPRRGPGRRYTGFAQA
jgi:hypothetical protein